MDERPWPQLKALAWRLNAAILCHRALAWILPAALAAGALVAGLRALGLAAAPYPLWLGLVAAAAATGAFLSRSSFISEAGAARWLDERLGTEGLLSAALVCLGRERSGRFDSEVVDRALALLPRARGVKNSRGPLARKAALSLAAMAIGAYLVFLGAPTTRLHAPLGNQAQAEGTEAGDKAGSLRRAQESGQAASAFATSLFPADRRRATLAERALREGRMDNLRDLLKSADLEYGSRLKGQVSEPERKRLVEERQRLQEAALALEYRTGRGGRDGGAGEPGDGHSARSGSGDRQRGGPLAEQGGQDRGARGEGSRGRPRSKPGEEGGALGSSGGDSGAGGNSGQAPGSGGPSKSRGWGSGPGQEGDWGSIEPPAKPGELAVEPSKDSSFFELVLPGQAPTKPLSSLLPDSRRASESAMSRESIPFEYRDFVSSYFLSLSKGEAR